MVSAEVISVGSNSHVDVVVYVALWGDVHGVS